MDISSKSWSCLPFDQLTTRQLYQILQLRADVFVVEQNCAYLDPDNRDIHPNCFHLFHQTTEGKITAYCRILAPNLAFKGSAIGRVVVANNDRGKNIGKHLMKQAISICQSKWTDCPIEISAQCQWHSFYVSLGFHPLGEQYLEDGIPHQHMMLSSAVD